MKQNRGIIVSLAATALLAVLACLPSQPSIAASGDVVLFKGKDFVKLRRELLKAGWQPVVSDYLDNNGWPLNQSPGPGGMYKAGFIEVEDCTVSPFLCTFNYRRGRQCLQIITEDGPYNRDNRARTVLREWSNECFRH